VIHLLGNICLNCATQLYSINRTKYSQDKVLPKIFNVLTEPTPSPPDTNDPLRVHLNKKVKVCQSLPTCSIVLLVVIFSNQVNRFNKLADNNLINF